MIENSKRTIVNKYNQNIETIDKQQKLLEKSKENINHANKYIKYNNYYSIITDFNKDIFYRQLSNLVQNINLMEIIDSNYIKLVIDLYDNYYKFDNNNNLNFQMKKLLNIFWEDDLFEYYNNLNTLEELLSIYYKVSDK